MTHISNSMVSKRKLKVTGCDPVSKHQIVLEGSIATIQGVNLVTDAFRYETLQVLNPGEVFFFGAPQTLGGIVQRKSLMTQSIDRYALMRPERGWFNKWN
jgi:hypothetical protein